MTPDEGLLLDELEAVLMQMSVVLPADKAVWDANQLLRFAVERLWILAGTTAELYLFRNILAHRTPASLNHDRVCRESVRDLPRVLERVRAERA